MSKNVLFSQERLQQAVLPPGMHIFQSLPSLLLLPLLLYTHYFSYQKYILAHTLYLKNSTQHLFGGNKNVLVQEVRICQHKSHLIFPFVLRVFQTLGIYKSPCHEITLFGNWTNILKTSSKLSKYQKKSDSGIEINDNINVKVYFSLVQTINLINKHLLS